MKWSVGRASLTLAIENPRLRILGLRSYAGASAPSV
jgi:hypothetical protein